MMHEIGSASECVDARGEVIGRWNCRGKEEDGDADEKNNPRNLHSSFHVPTSAGERLELIAITRSDTGEAITRQGYRAGAGELKIEGRNQLAVSSGGNEEEALRKLDLKVREIMRPNPLTISPDATVMQAAKMMEKHDSSCVFVKSKGKIVGIVTERDITRRVVGKGASLKKTKAKSVMTSRIVVTSPVASIEEALKVMTTNKVRRLPVVDEKGDMVGLVGTADVAKALAEKAGYSTSLITAMTKETLPPSGVYG